MQAGLAVVDGVVGVAFDGERRDDVGNDGRGHDLGEAIKVVVAVVVESVFGLALDDVGDVVVGELGVLDDGARGGLGCAIHTEGL